MADTVSLESSAKLTLQRQRTLGFIVLLTAEREGKQGGNMKSLCHQA